MRRSIATAAAILALAALTISPGRADSDTPQFRGWDRVGSGISEPLVDVAPDGTIFVHGPEGAPNHSSMWRSTDDGGSWQQINFGTALRRLPGGGDTDVVIRQTDTGNRIYFLDLWAGSNSLSVSEDNGDTWLQGTPFTTLPLSDRQWIALGPADPTTGLDTVYILYALIQNPSQVMIARSRTGGLTWEDHYPAPALLQAYGFTSTLLSDENGYLAFIWEDGSTLRAAYSFDEGETWGVSEISPRARGLISTVAMAGDDLYAVWIDQFAHRVRFSSSPDQGRTWTTPILLGPESLTSNIFAWVDAQEDPETGEDKVAVAWYASDDFTGDPNGAPGGTVYDAVYAESLDGGLTWSDTVVVGPGKTGRICTQGLGCDLGGGGGRELGDFMSVEIGPDMRSFVAFGGRVVAGAKIAIQIL